MSDLDEHGPHCAGCQIVTLMAERDALKLELARLSDPAPVPSREAIAGVLGEHRLIGLRCRCGFNARLDYHRYEQHLADAVLALWGTPTEPEAGITQSTEREA